MSEVAIREGCLEVRFSGLDAARAHRLSLKIPVSAVRSASVGIPAVALREPAKFWGNYHAGEILIGPEDAYDLHRESFYEVRHPERALTLELSVGRFEYVVLEPVNLSAEALIAELERAIGRRLPPAELPPGLMTEVHATDPAPSLPPHAPR